MDKPLIGAYLAVVALVSLVVGVPGYLSHTYTVNANVFQRELEDKGFTVIEGIVESPSLVIELSRSEFLAKVTEFDTTVYRYNWDFYVFEPDMLTAYRY